MGATRDSEYSDDTVQAESSTWAARRARNGKPTTGHCVACGDDGDFYEFARVPCDHEYWRPCLAKFFELSISDESVFPPRCDGQEILLDQMRSFLPSQLAKDFEGQNAELSTKNRIYCYEPTCSTFIAAAAIVEDVGTCSRCDKTKCSICKAPSHTGGCPEDIATQRLVETVEEHQWQRCYSCKRFVELETSCNHMT